MPPALEPAPKSQYDLRCASSLLAAAPPRPSRDGGRVLAVLVDHHQIWAPYRVRAF
jgi:hypothetical protein